MTKLIVLLPLAAALTILAIGLERKLKAGGKFTWDGETRPRLKAVAYLAIPLTALSLVPRFGLVSTIFGTILTVVVALVALLTVYDWLQKYDKLDEALWSEPLPRWPGRKTDDKMPNVRWALRIGSLVVVLFAICLLAFGGGSAGSTAIASNPGSTQVVPEPSSASDSSSEGTETQQMTPPDDTATPAPSPTASSSLPSSAPMLKDVRDTCGVRPPVPLAPYTASINPGGVFVCEGGKWVPWRGGYVEVTVVAWTWTTSDKTEGYGEIDDGNSRIMVKQVVKS